MSYPARAEGLVNRSRYLSLFLHSFSFILWSAGTAKSIILQIFFFFFLFIIIRSGLRAEIRCPVCISKSHRSLWVSFSRTGSQLCIYHLFVWSNLNFLHISQCITFPTQSCLALYSFYSNLLHSLIMWLLVSSLSPHSLNLLFCCVLSIFALIWLVLMALFCAAIRRDSVSLLKFPFVLLHLVRVFLYPSVSWQSFNGVWVTASNLISSEPFSIFRPISTMQYR